MSRVTDEIIVGNVMCLGGGLVLFGDIICMFLFTPFFLHFRSLSQCCLCFHSDSCLCGFCLSLSACSLSLVWECLPHHSHHHHIHHVLILPMMSIHQSGHEIYTRLCQQFFFDFFWAPCYFSVVMLIVTSSNGSFLSTIGFHTCKFGLVVHHSVENIKMNFYSVLKYLE